MKRISKKENSYTFEESSSELHEEKFETSSPKASYEKTLTIYKESSKE